MNFIKQLFIKINSYINSDIDNKISASLPPNPNKLKDWAKINNISVNVTNGTSLDLSSLSLSELPENISSLIDLEELNCSNNKLLNLPESIGELINLKVLNISNNMISVLPQSMRKLKSLTDLICDSNKLKNFPEWITELTNLKKPTLSDNKINEITDNTSKLSNLEHFSRANKIVLENTVPVLPKNKNITQPEIVNPAEPANENLEMFDIADDYFNFNANEAINNRVMYQIGFDFGSTFSKIVISINNRRLLVDFRNDLNNPEFLLPSTIYVNNAEFSIRPTEGYEKFQDLKRTLIKDPNNQDNRNHVVYFFTDVLLRIDYYLYQNRDFLVGKDEYISVIRNINIGIPCAGINNNLAELYKELMDQAISSFYQLRMRNSNVEVIEQPEGYRRNINTVTELSASVYPFINLKNAPRGTFYLFDVGGLTLDLIAFQYGAGADYGININPNKLSLYRARVSNVLGANEEDLNLNDVLKFMKELHASVRTRNRIGFANGNIINVIKLGGGVNHDVYNDILNNLNNYLNYDPIMDIKLEDLLIGERLFENVTNKNVDINRFVLAYGLSYLPKEFSDVAVALIQDDEENNHKNNEIEDLIANQYKNVWANN